MRTAICLMALWGFSYVGLSAATAVHWEERPFFARRPNQKVPPPQYYATCAELPAGTEIRIKVIKCPKKADLTLHEFLGGPVFSKGVVNEFSDLTTDQVLTYKLAKKMTVGITTQAGDGDSKGPGTCAGLERKEDHEVMKYSFGDLGELTVEVEVVGQ